MNHQPAIDLDYTNCLPLALIRVEEEWWLTCTTCSTFEEAVIGKLYQAGMPLSNGIVLDRGIDHALAKHFGLVLVEEI